MTVTDKYQFRYRLLASVDVIGSTAFKSGQASKNQPWAHVFEGFFEDFPKTLESCFSAVSNLLDSKLIADCKPPKCMEIWKLVGDEILFVAELSRHEHAAFHVIALKNAVTEYSQFLKEKHGLGLKATVWGAGFPVVNVQVTTKAGLGVGTVQDFLGPSVDLGFRLATLADHRRMPLSADIALFLTRTRLAWASIGAKLEILVDEPRILKGINGGRPYPTIWLDRRDGEPTVEDQILDRNRKCKTELLLQYLGEQFSDGTMNVPPPFIEGDPSPHFRTIPPHMAQARQRLVDEDLEGKYSKSLTKPVAVGKKSTPPPLPRDVRGNALAKLKSKKPSAKRRR